MMYAQYAFPHMECFDLTTLFAELLYIMIIDIFIPTFLVFL